MKETLELGKSMYNNSVHIYTLLFCQKHGFNMSDGFWVADCLGTIYSIADYYFSFEDMRYDLDNNVDEDLLLQWYEYGLKAHENGEPTINYSSFITLTKTNP